MPITINNKNSICYFITYDNYKEKIVPVGGPYQNIDDVLKINGVNENSVIIENNTVEGSKPIYRWTGERWRKV